MAAKIKKGDVVEVMRGRTSDEKKLRARNERREEQGLDPLAPGDKGKQGRVIKVFPKTRQVLVEGVNLKTHHMRPGQGGQEGGIVVKEAPIDIAKVALVDPDTKQPVRVGFREEVVDRDGKMKTIRVRVARGGTNRGVTPGKELDA